MSDNCDCPPPVNGLRHIMGDVEYELFVMEIFGLIPPRKVDYSMFNDKPRLPRMAVVLDRIDKRIGY